MSLAMCSVTVISLNAMLRYSADDNYNFGKNDVTQQRDIIQNTPVPAAPPKQRIADFSDILKPPNNLKPQGDDGVARYASRREYSRTEDANYHSPIEIPDDLPNIIKNDLSDGPSIDQPIPDEFLPVRKYTSSSEIIISTAQKREGGGANSDRPQDSADEREGEKSHTGAKKHKAGKKSSGKKAHDIEEAETTITKAKWPAKAIGKPEHVTKTSISVE
ncbi:MAG: hypothetical protein LBJ03_02585 [Holosporales bacterium]|nr:hypothetical protein [Holosporales bacterium]